MADDFNESDLVNLNDETPQASETPQLTDEQAKAIDDAMNRVFGNKSDQELDAEADASGDAEVSQKLAERRQSRRRQQKLEEAEELREDGLEDNEQNQGDDEGKPAEPAETPAVETPKTSDEPAEPTPEAPALDPTVRYLAESELGWSAEKIDAFVKADPALASEALGKLVEQYTNLSRQMVGSDGTQVAPGSPAPENTPAPEVYSPTPKLDKFFEQLESFQDANGEELTTFIKHLKDELVEPFKANLAKLEAEKVELRKTEAISTFDGLREKFPQLYGNGDKVSDEQLSARRELSKLADDLRGVAKQRGHDMSVKEALNRAHAVLAAKHATEIARKELKQQVQTRGRAVVAKPSNRANPVRTLERSREKAMEAVGQKAAELGVRGFED